VAELFAGFTLRDVGARGARIRARVGGDGPPLLLLHGYPQTHAIWHRVAPRLAERFTVVATDLRGYGDSEAPPSAPDHAPYSKRAMAQDQVEVMEALGFGAFHVVGHDRGGRVGHRMALDHPGRVRTLTVLDIAPTRHMYEGTSFEFARTYFHWFFLIQPPPLPERLIGSDPEFYLRSVMRRGPAGLSPFDPAVFAEYVRCFDAGTIAASCEDYRAAATLDLEHDRADEERRVTAPLLVLWGRHGVVQRCFDALAAWRERAVDVRGAALECGHYIPEQAPDALLEHLLPHLLG
jgi:haloacetate dehalogenase